MILNNHKGCYQERLEKVPSSFIGDLKIGSRVTITRNLQNRPIVLISSGHEIGELSEGCLFKRLAQYSEEQFNQMFGIISMLEIWADEQKENKPDAHPDVNLEVEVLIYDRNVD